MPRKSAASGAGSRYGRIPLVQRVVIVDRERRVVRESLFLVDRAFAGGGGQCRRRDLVIDAPTHVLGPGLAAIRPPRVLVRPAIDAAEYIHPSELVENAREPRPFLREKPRILPIAAPVLEIDFLMRDVPVAAQHDLAAFGAQRPQMRKETLHEAELDALTRFTAGTRRLVERNDRQPGKVDAQIPAFAIDVRDTDAFHDLD